MKEGIGGVFLFNIVILFILLFTGIMTLTINRSKAYSVKDEIIAEIERKDGISLSGGSLPIEIVDAMQNASYRAEGQCSSDNFSSYDRDGNLSGTIGNSGMGSICIEKIPVSESEFAGEKACYYSVELFYKIDIPLIENALTFRVSGETKVLYANC